MLVVLRVLLSLALLWPSIDAVEPGWAEKALAEMSLDEKIGQLFIVTAISDHDLLSAPLEDFFTDAARYTGLSSWQDYGNKAFIEKLILHYHIGGIIYLGKARASSQLNLTNHFRSISKHPLFIALDCEWGMYHRLSEAVRFPLSMTLGAIRDHTLLYAMGQEVATQCKSLGVNINFAPCVDVNSNPLNPVINIRAYGDDPQKVSSTAMAYMQGMQDNGIIACAKHFPGHGDTHLDSHLDLPSIDKSVAALEKIELYPFKQMIEGRVKAIMTAHLEVPALDPHPHLPASLSRLIVSDLLRKQMDFKGLIITDALIMKGVHKFHQPGEIELQALQAGNDILLCPSNVPAAVKAIKRALAAGTLTLAELDEHVLRILQAKEYILKEDGFRSDLKDLHALQTEQALDLKHQLYAEAITLCGTGTNLPHARKPLCLIESPSQEISPLEDMLEEYFPVMQTISIDPEFDETSINTLCDQVKEGAQIVFSISQIDAYNLQTYGISQAVLKTIQTLKSRGHPLCIVLFGTPYSLRLFDKDATVIIAYESEPAAYQAAAEVLLGQRRATGMLPIADTR